MSNEIRLEFTFVEIFPSLNLACFASSSDPFFAFNLYLSVAVLPLKTPFASAKMKVAITRCS